MTRKLHQLTGQIKYAWLSQTKTRELFYYLEITQESLLGKTTQTIYAFSNLVSKDIWNALATENYKQKTYHFFCEKRVRGWRLKNWVEIN
jgi:hypothetical protein